MQGPFLRKYGVEATVDFDLYEVDGVDLRVDAAHAAGDSKIMKDEGAEANTANGFTDEGSTYSIVLTAAEMEAARIKIILIDTATKVWLDDTIVIETYGNASAMHAMDFDDAVRGGMTALPNAAADAAGGIPISDAGGLDLDTQIGTDIDAILTDSAVIGALGAGLTAIPWNAAWDAEAQSEVADALAAFFTSAAQLVDDIWDEVLTGATHNVNNSAGKRLRTIDAAFEVSSGTARAGTSTTITLAADETATDDIYNGDRIVIVGGTGQGEHGIVTDYDGTSKVATMSKAWVVTPDATSEYEVVPADTDVETWNNIAVTSDGDWNELQTDVDAILVDTNELQTDWTNAGRLDALIDLILADTGELQTDWVNAGRLDALLDAIKERTDNLPDDPADDSDIDGQLATIVADTGELQTDWANGGRLDLLIDAILADSGELQVDWVNGGRLDLLIDAILADSGELQTDLVDGGRLDLILDAILADSNELQGEWADAGRLDALLDLILGDTNELQTDDVPTLIAALNDLSSANVGDAVLDEAVESTETLRQLLRLMRAVLLGKSQGGGTTTPDFRDRGDTKNRVTVTADADGNRTAVTTDPA